MIRLIVVLKRGKLSIILLLTFLTTINLILILVTIYVCPNLNSIIQIKGRFLQKILLKIHFSQMF
jgi:hypothetical protein